MALVDKVVPTIHGDAGDRSRQPARFHRLELLGAIVAAFILAAIVHVTEAWPALREARPVSLLLAAGLHAVSLLLWSTVWVHLLSKEASKVKRWTAVAVSMASLIGFLTPMNIGTDVLRSFYGKRHLRLGYHVTGAASVVARETKLHVTLALVLSVALGSVSLVRDIATVVAAAVATTLLLLGALYTLRTRASSRLARRLGIDDMPQLIRRTTNRLSLTERGAIYLAFAVAFALEWLSLHLCFVSLDIRASPADTASLYTLLYVLSRTPVAPQGLGVVEAGGFVVLAAQNIAAASIGALLVLWAFLRILVPVGLAFFFSLGLSRRRES
jgi:uncharacterized protein (TIRG00374 family)